MLDGLTILIVEDEPLVALDLADAVEALGGHVLGPVESVGEALKLVETSPPAAAILDANLADRDVTPLAICLIERGTPFVVLTGQGLPVILDTLHPGITVVMKPSPTANVLKALEARIQHIC